MKVTDSLNPRPILGYEQAVRAVDLVDVYDFTEIRRILALFCPYCGTSSLTHPVTTDGDEVCRCNCCGWWKRLDLRALSKGWGRQDIPSFTSIASRFAVSDLDVPVALLRQFIATHPNQVTQASARVFELLVRDCFRDAFAPCEVVHVGRSGDGGIDLKLILADATTYLIQVKRRTNLRKLEGVEVVRTLNGVLFREGIPKGMVITTAKAFSRAAHEATTVATPTVVPYDMKLIAFDELVSMLRLTPCHPYHPWTRFTFNQPEAEKNQERE